MVWIRSINGNYLMDCKHLSIDDVGHSYLIREHTSVGVFTMASYSNKCDAEKVMDAIIKDMSKYEKNHEVICLL